MLCCILYNVCIILELQIYDVLVSRWCFSSIEKYSNARTKPEQTCELVLANLQLTVARSQVITLILNNDVNRPNVDCDDDVDDDSELMGELNNNNYCHFI